MNEKTLRALVEAGAIKRVHIIADGAKLHVKADTPTGSVIALTQKGEIKTWMTMDAAAKWVRSLGIGSMQLDVAKWQPGQRELRV